MRHDAGGVKVAFFGAMSHLAQEVRRQLEVQAFPIARLRLFDVLEMEGSVTEYDGEAMLVTHPDRDLLADTDLSFICGEDDPRSAEYLAWVASSKGRAVDLVGASRQRPEVPLINCDVNPKTMEGGPRTVAVPHSLAHPLSTILHQLGKRFRLADACVTILRPVSDLGKEGIEELQQQTVGLLNFSSVSKEVFGRQIAFNLFPVSVQGEEGAILERLVREDVLRVLSAPDLSLSVRILQAPIFYGHCYSIRACFDGAPAAADMEEVLECPGVIRVSREDEGRTPVELGAEEGIWIADISPEPSREGAFWIWAISDAVRSGTARNAARLAGLLVGSAA